MCNLTFVSQPRMTPATFRAVLAAFHSPALPQAAALFAIPISYGLDPAIALAFFVHESSCGTQGRARFTKNWGNLRKGQGNQIINAGGWAWYGSWENSLKDWCILISAKYVHDWHLPTISLALAKYAPSSDNNDPNGYAATVCRLVTKWEAA